MKRIDYVGERFGRLVVTGQYYSRTAAGKRLAHCHCACDCGAVKAGVPATYLRTGRTRSCGCLQREAQHLMTQTPEYRAWHNIIGRCTNPRDRSYRNYGARGIQICQAWRDSFQAFYEHVGPRPSARHSIDRIDNERGYEPGNVRWATMHVQSRNRRNNRLLTHRGVTLPLIDWAQRIGIPVKTLARRFEHGWSLARALTEPVDERKVSAARRRSA